MKNNTFSLQGTGLLSLAGKSSLFWRIFCILSLLIGLYSIAVILPSPVHAATTDCHNAYTAPGNAYQLSSATYTIVTNNGPTPTAIGDLEIALFYCPAYQSVFGRFAFTSVDGSPSLTGACAAIDNAGTGFQPGCTDGLPNGQIIDTQIISASGGTWYAYWTNQSFDAFCQDSNGTMTMICKTPSATTPTP